MAGSPLVSVIVPSVDGRDLLADCLAGLRAQVFSRDRFEVIVVDNGSTDGTSAWLAAEYPEVVAVLLGENLGFAEGSNRGAEAARGELLVFLNNDAVPEPRFLEELVRSATGPERPDCVAARILDRDGDAVEFGGASVNVFGLGSQHSSWQRRFSEAKDGEALPFACGGAMLVRAEVFRRVGGFDRDYFAYYEDVDLGWRLWLSGHRVVYSPAAEVRHRRHATGERFPDSWRHFHWYRNALLTLLKNSEEELLPRLLPFAFALFFQRIGALYHSAARAFADGDAERARFLLGSAVGGADGLSWLFAHIDELREKRRGVQALRRVPDRALADRFDIRLDFGAEADVHENARVLGLLPFLDLSSLMDPERAGAAALAAARCIAEDAAAAVERIQPELVAWHAEAGRLGRELHERNLEVMRLHRELHSRNLDVLELERLLRTERSGLGPFVSFRTLRWTSLPRRLAAVFRHRPPR